jgi:hypothetical protein
MSLFHPPSAFLLHFYSKVAAAYAATDSSYSMYILLFRLVVALQSNDGQGSTPRATTTTTMRERVPARHGTPSMTLEASALVMVLTHHRRDV